MKVLAVQVLLSFAAFMVAFALGLWVLALGAGACLVHDLWALDDELLERGWVR